MLVLGSSVAVSEAITRYPVLSGQAMRYGLAALVLGAWVGLRREYVRPTLPELGRLVALGATGLAAFNVFLVLALRGAEPAAVGVVVGAVPIVLAVLGPLLAGSRPAPRVVVAAMAVTAGAAVVQGGGRAGLLPVMFALAAMASEAAFSLIAEPVLPRLGAASVSLHACITATVILAGAAPLFDAAGAFPRPSPTEAVAFAYLAVVVNALGFVLWYEGLKRLGSARAGLFAGLVPVSTLLTAVVIGGGGLTPRSAIGTIVVGLGLALGLAGPGHTARRDRGPGPSSG